MIARRIALYAVIVGSISTVCLAADGEAKCTDCHATEAGRFAASVHSSLTCQDCHQGEASYSVPETELKQYTSRAGGKSFDHGSSFAGKPTRSAIPSLCGDCHADVERMNPYGLRTDQLARYRTSNHGKTLAEKGDERVAVCTDCHGIHDVLAAADPDSRTHPLNVPSTCAMCHADVALMGDYDLPVEIVDEYRQSVHGKLLLEQKDTGAPTCATCHGNHSAMPPGFATVGSVCGQCHQAAAGHFGSSIHATLEDHKKCVQCHGGGEGRHFHKIDRITKPAGVLVQRYAHLLEFQPDPTDEQITGSIHPDPRKIITQALPTCLECHDELEEDESLPTLFALLDGIAEAERNYVKTGQRLEEVGRGLLLVDRQRFEFEDAKTFLIELAPLQHTLDNEQVAAKVAELNAVCEKVNAELDALERGLEYRHTALWPVWIFSIVFGGLLYVKYKQLKHHYVKPLPKTGV